MVASSGERGLRLPRRAEALEEGGRKELPMGAEEGGKEG